MVRLLSQLLALLALLLAPLPAAATAPTAAAAVTAEAEHCEQTDAGAGQWNGDDPQQDEKHPCCKNSMSSCCPIAAQLAGSGSPPRAASARSAHRSRVVIFLLGTSGPPLTEPPTFA